MHANRIFGFSLVSLFLSFPIRAQIVRETFLEARFPDGSVGHVNLIPTAAAVLFPHAKVVLEKTNARIHLENVNGTPFEKLQFVTVGDYASPHIRKTISSERKKSAPMRTARITAVLYDNKVYVVNPLFWGENTATISALLRVVGANIDGPEKALQLAEFFLQFGYYRFGNPNSFVVSKLGDLPRKQIEFPGQSTTEMENAIHAPTVEGVRNAYKVGVVTYDRDAAFVVLHHWTISFLDSQITEAREQVLLPDHMRSRVGEGPSNSMSGTLASPASSVQFHLSIMADEKTSDSAHLNVSTYTFTTSDGPLVRRSVYYFKSRDRAIRELKDRLNRANQILELGKWT